MNITLHNPIKYILLCVSVLLLSGMTVEAATNQDNSAILKESEVLMGRYVSALKNGDLNTIRVLLGPKLLRKRDRLLSNPSYSDQLVQHYNNVSYTITGQRMLNNDSVSINVSISRNQSVTSKYRFVIQKTDQAGIVIVSEEEIL